MQDIASRLSQAESAVERLVGARDTVMGMRQELVVQIEQAKVDIGEEENVQVLLNKSSHVAWNRAKGQLEVLVNRALKAIFPNRSYKFVIVQEVKRGGSSISLILEEDGVEMDVWEEGGLGVADVIGFALRIALLVLYKPKVQPILFLDEPFRNLSMDYVSNASKFMKQVAQELGIQLVLVTHNTEFISDAEQVIRLDKINGRCQIV